MERFRRNFENSEQNLDIDALKFRNLGKIQNHLISEIWKFTTQNMVPGGKITLSNYVCLPPSNKLDDDNVGRTAWVYGWGILGDGLPISNVLMETKGRVTTRKICQKKWTLDNGQTEHFIEQHHLCIDHPAGKGDCNEDSGGPQTRAGPDNRHILIGLSSLGPKNCGVKFSSALQVYFIESIFIRILTNQISAHVWHSSGNG